MNHDSIHTTTEAGSDYSLLWFYSLAFILHFGVTAIAMTLNLVPLQLLTAWTPNLAAFVVIFWVLQEKRGVRRLMSGWTKWRVGPWWYVVALSPIWVAIAVVGGTVVMGAPLPSFMFPQDFVTIIGAAVLAIATGATGEELGWRGFALPRLQQRFSAFTSSVILGLLWGVWHLPQYFTGLILGDPTTWVSFTRFCIYTTALTILMTWVANHTNHSLVMASLFHWASNVVLIPLQLLPSIPPDLYFTARTIIFTFFAVIVTLAFSPAQLKKSSPNR